VNAGESSRLYVEVGNRIRKIRSAKAPYLSQGKLASLVAISRTSIVNIEQGKHRVQLHVLCAIADVLGVTMSDLVPLKSKPIPARLPRKTHSAEELVPREEQSVIKFIATHRRKK